MSIQNFLVEENGALHFGGARMVLLDIASGFWGLRRQLEALIGQKLTSSVLQQAGTNGGASFAKSFAAQAGSEGFALFSACIAAYQTAGFGKFEIVDWQWPIGRVQIRATKAFEAWMYQQQGNVPDMPICAYTSGVFVGFVNILSNRQDIVCLEHSCQAQGDAVCSFELVEASAAGEQTVVSYMPDPGLGRHLNLLEMLFEHMPMGIAVLDRQYRIQRYNPTWDDFSARYAPAAGIPLAQGISYFDHLPGTEPIIEPLFERALSGETVRQNNVRLELEGLETYWDIVLSPLLERGDILGILIVSIDVTERVNLRTSLEQRISARTQELQILLDIAAAANISLDLEEMLTRSLDQLVELVGASRVGVGLIDQVSRTFNTNILRPERDVDSREMAKILQASWAVIDSGEMKYIKPDASKRLLEPGALLPLQIRDRKLGILVIIGPKGSGFSPDQLALFKSIADQLSVAIENAYLYEKAEDMAIAAERNRLARDLHDAVTQTLFSASLIADVLPRIWERDMEQGRKRLGELQELTRGALAEMRTLLLELRPASLTESSLAELLQQLTQAIGGRSRLPVDLIIEEERPLPSEIQVALYRIAQEALNNITKYAAASQVKVKLSFPTQAVQLSIADDGRGFDLADIKPHSLGIGIMRERAQRIGATLTINSQIGEGTVIDVQCPLTKGYRGNHA